MVCRTDVHRTAVRHSLPLGHERHSFFVRRKIYNSIIDEAVRFCYNQKWTKSSIMERAGWAGGAALTHAPATVKKYLGFTLLPHSGVSLVFTGIAVSVLQGPAPECAQIIQGTIAAAAVINEVIAVFIAKKGFEWAGELNKAVEKKIE